MTVFGICLAKDESDIIAATVGHMLTQVDEVIVADNMSTDGTGEILAGLGVKVVEDRDPAHYQSRKVTALASVARGMGADWVVPFDADEVWLSAFGGTVKDALEAIPDDWLVAAATLYDHVPTGTDPQDPNPLRRMRHRRPDPLELPKVAARCRDGLVIEDGNHGARYDFRPAHLPGQLVVRHFPYRSAEQFVAKVRKGAAALAATDLPADTGAHWRGYGAILEAQGEDACVGIFREHFWQPDATGLIYDPVPCP